MNKEETIKRLLKDNMVQEEIRYDVRPMISYDLKVLAKSLKEIGITEEEFKDYIHEYTSKRAIFFFATIKKTWDDIKFKIDHEVVKPQPRLGITH